MEQDWHISSGEAAIMLCLSGTAIVNVNGRPVHAERGIVFALSPIGTLFLQEEKQARWLRFTISQHTAVEISRNATKAQGNLRLLTNPSIQLTEEETLFLEDIHRRIVLREQQLATTPHEEHILLEQQIRILQQLVVSELAIKVNQQTKKPLPLKREEELMAAFLQLLLSNYRTHRDVKWYAGQLHLSPRYFSSLIHSGSGFMPSEWITRIVILNAKMLLDRPNARIKDVAEELGFPEQFTFRKYFKHYTGLSPKQYQTTARG